MSVKTKADIITSLSLIICSSIVILLPLLSINNVKVTFIIIMLFYMVSNLINYLLVKKSKDREGLYTSIVCLISLILANILNVMENPIYLAFILLIWTFGMSLVKLKKADYYHDRKNNMWIMHIITLFIFILIGLLTAVNLYYAAEIQILMLGNFFFINGILDLIDPLANLIKEKN
ncbi:MAG: hypothetical protein IJN03_01560 [Bacilli bacterium]|nr:hypothetical protein [Bacilli bacterium]